MKMHYFNFSFSIKKNAIEQVEFLKGIYLNEFNLSGTTRDILKKGMLFKKTALSSIYTRKGTGPLGNNSGIGWLIGWIEKGTKTFFFAFNIESNGVVEAGKLRNDYSLRILKALDLTD